MSSGTVVFYTIVHIQCKGWKPIGLPQTKDLVSRLVVVSTSQVVAHANKNVALHFVFSQQAKRFTYSLNNQLPTNKRSKCMLIIGCWARLLPDSLSVRGFFLWSQSSHIMRKEHEFVDVVRWSELRVLLTMKPALEKMRSDGLGFFHHVSGPESTFVWSSKYIFISLFSPSVCSSSSVAISMDISRCLDISPFFLWCRAGLTFLCTAVTILSLSNFSWR